ncbi:MULTISPECIES: hypothetical protein [Campylobacter]|uniref:Cell division protein n=1 Tax=Campylobacter porcelli TaxID=1660073 RepID=A0A1X9SWV8_9BACT|nr:MULTISPECIES: hypothetical protein [unclassified Campylobacter]MCR8678361.1 hypothetical protein [Campylobacter sp. RM19072]MCR8695712.1 hypothetical protein [Campylobacter sp. RM19073]MEE3704286.1 hypothetical protein [Campylobacter sp. CX2-8023-23]MEE3743933.1 hypothetical protein [Campylobacter sp. CX2-4855-23]MEE3776191.1 hypothetical protein [Campylobacter sp. CX2-4080-23]
MKNYENDVTLEEMSYELELATLGMLYYAGVKKELINEAFDRYIDVIDDVLEDSDANGVDEVIAVVEYMKKNYPELFK